MVNSLRPRRIQIRQDTLNKYGITLQQAQTIWDAQERSCGICCNDQARMVVDHNHQTNEVRGFLCHKCNVMLGLADDIPEILLAGAEYLQRKSYTGIMKKENIRQRPKEWYVIRDIILDGSLTSVQSKAKKVAGELGISLENARSRIRRHSVHLRLVGRTTSTTKEPTVGDCSENQQNHDRVEVVGQPSYNT